MKPINLGVHYIPILRWVAFDSNIQFPQQNREFPFIRKECLFFVTPWKMNMEPKNHPFTKENRLPNLHFQGSMLNFGGADFVRTSTPAVHGVPGPFCLFFTGLGLPTL